MENIGENSSLRYNVVPGKDEDACRNGDPEPRRQVHLGGPRRKSYDFDRGRRRYFLLKDQKFEPLKNRTWAVATPNDSFFSKTHQAKSNVSSHSMLFWGPMISPKQRPQLENRWAKSRQKGRIKHPKSINDRFLDGQVNVNPAFTCEQLLAEIQHHASWTVDDIAQKCSRATYRHHIIFMSMMKELEVNNKT